MRTFVALELPGEFSDEVAGLARQLKPVVPGRYTPRGNYHVTLAFLGEIGEAQARDAIEALEDACGGAPPVELRADGLGYFGKPSDATLWLGIAATPELLELCARVRAQLAAYGLSFDGKPFRPHVTLARRARLPKGELPALAFPLPDTAATVALFKSTLTPDGPIYKPLYPVGLTGLFASCSPD